MSQNFIGFPLNFDHGAVVYCLQNTRNGKVYIGKSMDFFARLSAHRASLKNDTHTNEEMQSDFNRGDDFLVICLFRYPAISKKFIKEHTKDINKAIDNMEQEFIHEFQAVERGYNKRANALEYPPPTNRTRPLLRPCEHYAAEVELSRKKNVV